MDEFPCKNSEKSSPSFPEDADYDEEQISGYHQSESHENPPSAGSPVDKLSSDVTLVADEEDDEMEGIKPLSSVLDSPKPNVDMGDKKVHWTTRHVQLLLNCVEEHLNEFNVQKKHKAVWQAIGAEMEPYGFTTEHCYNKWKNLRRDVRLLVNNPSKVVRNAAILRQVARLILVIYPNVDANTMQVCDRSGIKSLPATPGGQGGVNKTTTVDVHYSGFNSPHGKLGNGTPSRYNNSLYAAAGSVNVHSTPSSVEKSFCGQTKSGNVPGTALFVDSLSNGDKVQNIFNQGPHPEPESTGPFQFPFNQTAAALFFQSHLFSDLVKQQQFKNQMDPKSQDQAHDLSAAQNGASSTFSILQQALSNPPCNDLNALSAITTNLLNSMAGLTPQVNDSDCPNSDNNGGNNPIVSSNANANPLLGVFPNIPPGLLERFAPNNCEITEIIESLRAEDNAQFRVADIMSDAAEQLRRACQRRQAALDKLLDLVKRQAKSAGSSAGDTGSVT